MIFRGMRSTKEIEDDIGDLLDVFFASVESATVRIRNSLKYGSEEGYRSYSPIIDISVGPFSEVRGVSLWGEYDNLVRFSSHVIDDMLEQFKSNYQEFGEGYFRIEERTLPDSYREFLTADENQTVESLNWNARCFMAIEIEDSRNPKHLLGDMINVSVSARVGIVIGCNQDSLAAFLRQLDYLAYTVKAKKVRFSSKNIIVLKPEQLKTVLVNNLQEV